MSGILKRLNCKPLLVNGVKDHVHVLLVAPPTLCLADIVEKLKANSSRWVHETFPQRRRFAWQAGYTAFTVSPSNRKRVLDYITGQEEHHRHRTYLEEVQAFLAKSGMTVGAGSELD